MSDESKDPIPELEQVWAKTELGGDGDRSGCPAPERLTALAAGDLPAAERLALVDHLVGCADCAAELRLLRELEPWAADAGETIAAPSPSTERARGGRRSTAPWIAAAAAASIAVVCAVGWGRAAHRGAERAQSNVPVVDLLAEGTLRAAQPPARIAIPVPPDGAPLVLVLAADQLGAGPFRVEVLRDGRALTHLDRLTPTSYGNLTLMLPAATLAPGDYVLRLRTTGSPAGSVIGTFAFSLQGDH